MSRDFVGHVIAHQRGCVHVVNNVDLRRSSRSEHRLSGRLKLCIVVFALLLYVAMFNMISYSMIASTSAAVTYQPQLPMKSSAPMVIGVRRGYRPALKPDCLPLRFSKHPLPRVALASFPGSGNTWVRHLVQQATGLLTGSVYHDFALKHTGFPAEGVSNRSVVLVKTHEWGTGARHRYDKAVILLRNPYDAIMAEFNRFFAGHKGHAKRERYEERDVWNTFVDGKGRSLVYFSLDWLKFRGPIHIVHYEKLLSNPWQQLEGILQFLEADYTLRTLQCALDNSEGNFKRKIKHDLSYDPFSESMRKVIDIYQKTIDLAIQLRKVTSRGRTV